MSNKLNKFKFILNTDREDFEEIFELDERDSKDVEDLLMEWVDKQIEEHFGDPKGAGDCYSYDAIKIVDNKPKRKK